MPSASTECKRLEALERENARLREIVDALMSRVEREQAKMDDGAYGYFQAAMALEERVRQRTQALESALTRLETSNAQLREAKDEADRANSAKSEFLATMSHEIRTPMHGVVGAIELLARTRVDDEQRSLVRTLREACDSMLRLIDDVLDIARLEREKVELDYEPVDLREFLGSLTSLYAPRAMSKGLSFSCDIQDSLPQAVLADAHRLRQILSNLLSNAVKFTNSGFVSLCASAASVQDGRASLVFSVRDSGIGIAASQRDKIFEAFRQADSSTTRLYGGTGLGLAIASRLAEAMAATISLEDGDAVGSVFSLHIPLTVVAEAAEAPGTPPPESVGLVSPSASRFLVVDDSKLNRDVLTRMLRGHAAHIDEVENGVDAVSACRSVRYDMVFMDWRMPKMDGLQATQHIRKLPSDSATSRTVPILGLTANAHADDLAECTDVGMDRVLPKPFPMEDLHRLVSEMLAPGSVARAG